MAKTIVVLGVTGTQGGSVASTFLSKGWTVRGVTRNTTSPSSLSLKAKGIELVSADLDDASPFTGVFSGAHAVFAITDFWQPFFSSFGELTKKSDRATGEHAFAVEMERGKNIVDAAAKVIYHFDSKAAVTNYIKEEQPELWKKTSLLNMAFYTTNMLKYSGLMGAAKDDESGKYVMKTPGAVDAIHPFVVPQETGIFADLLVRRPPGINLLACNELASYETFMKVWSEITGAPSEVRQQSVDDADKAAPGGIGREAAESTACSAEFGWGQREGTLKLPMEIDPDIKLTSLRGYFEGEDWTAFLGTKSDK